MSRGVPRFDWRHAIVTLAHEVESALRIVPEVSEFSRPRLLREAQSKSEHAAWLARSYGYRYRSRKAPAREVLPA